MKSLVQHTGSQLGVPDQSRRAANSSNFTIWVPKTDSGSLEVGSIKEKEMFFVRGNHTKGDRSVLPRQKHKKQ